MEKKTLAILGGIIILVVVLLVIGNKQANPIIVSEDGTEIPCLPNGHQQVATHIHPILTLTVDGEEEIIPGNIGIDGYCMREVHTHDTTGTIHIETAKAGVVYTLTDFFTVWGQNVEREGYAYEIVQDGEMKESVEDVVLIDHSVIELIYTSL
jgi:hypothetical protein